jgi:transposase
VERGESEAVVAGGADVVAAVIALLEARIAELGADSRNSSRPPSSDGYAKPRADPKKRSLRRSSGRSQGGQGGHGGAHLERVAVPDERVGHPPERCDSCDSDLGDVEQLEGGVSCQVFDLREDICLRVLEHVALRRRCGCGHTTAGSFPAGVAAPARYGQRLRAFAVYLVVHQHLPYERACQLFEDLTGARISTATLKAWVDQAADSLTDFTSQIQRLLRAAPVVHFDETGGRMEGVLGWIHCASTGRFTLYSAHVKRGCEGVDAAGVLSSFQSVAMHDGWAPYRSYIKASHALCGAHHLRELLAAEEAGQMWASGMSALLLDAKHVVAEARVVGSERLAEGILAELHDSYREVIASGYEENPVLRIQGAGRWPKRTKAQNLLLRLPSTSAKSRHSVLRS